MQGRSLLPRLADLPQVGGRQNIAQFAWYGLQGGVHEVDGIRIYPVAQDPYGNDIIGAHSHHWRADVVISLIDVWVMRDTAKNVAPALWCPWLPIDHDPVPVAVLKSLEGAHLPLTYAKWGHRMLSEAGIENVYIPHGIEPDVFRVLPDQDKVREFKAKITKSDNGHLTIMVAANKGFPDRKAFQVQLRAWAEFAADKPDAWLYIHTEPTRIYGGPDLYELARLLGIQKRVLWPDRYEYFLGMAPEKLALLYNAADIYLGAAMSEGFGIPIIEAQACGIPAIVTNFSAMPELVRWGRAVDPIDRVLTPMNSWQAWPDVNGIREALDEFYDFWEWNDRIWPIDQRQEISRQIHDEYGWDSIVRDDWLPLLDRLIVDLANRGIEPRQQAQRQNGHYRQHEQRENLQSVEDNDLIPVAQ